MNVQHFRGVSEIIFGNNVWHSNFLCFWNFKEITVLPYFMYVNSEGSGETVQMRRLTWAIAGGLCDKYHNLLGWLIYSLLSVHEIRGARWLSGRVSDSGARGPGFETYRRRVVSLSKTLYSPKVLVNYPGSDGSVPTWLKNCWLGR